MNLNFASMVEPVDIFVIVVVLGALIAGWRQGALASVLSTVGVIAGLICGLGLAPVLMTYTDNQGLRFLLAIGALILLVAIGNMVGGYLGTALREQMLMRSSQVADSFIGSIFQTVTALFVVWLIAIPLASTSLLGLNEKLPASKILGEVDHLMPASMHQLPTRIAAMLSDSGLPPLMSPLSKHSQVEVDAPAIKVEDVALVERLRPSVVHVMGDAGQCSRRLMGSGFVVDADHIITNAHVVAGTDKVRVDTVVGMKDATVVSYNSEEDIAVLYSPELGLPALHWATEPAVTGEDTIVMGFPESGPFEAAPGRVRDRITINGPDIYATTRIDRESYTVRGTIRQGNSGGPMVNLAGEVLGVVFGAAVDKSDTGYVLTADEVERSLGSAATIAAMRTPVNTDRCVA